MHLSIIINEEVGMPAVHLANAIQSLAQPSLCIPQVLIRATLPQLELDHDARHGYARPSIADLESTKLLQHGASLRKSVPRMSGQRNPSALEPPASDQDFK